MPTLTWTEVDAIATIGDPIPIAALDEIQSNVNLLNVALGIASTTGTFAGPTGVTLTFATQGSTNYIVVVTPSKDITGGIGEISVENVSATQAKVYNTGSAGGTFRYKVMP